MPRKKTERTEQDYLDLAEQSKQRFEEFERKEQSLLREILQLKTQLLEAFGLVLALQRIIKECDECDNRFSLLSSCLLQALEKQATSGAAQPGAPP